MSLEELYSKRLKGIDINNVEDMKELYEKDEKTFYFLLMYFFLSNYKIPFDIKLDVIIANAVTLFCISVNDTEVLKYFSEYIDINETPNQIEKIMAEIVQDKVKKSIDI